MSNFYDANNNIKNKSNRITEAEQQQHHQHEQQFGSSLVAHYDESQDDVFYSEQAKQKERELRKMEEQHQQQLVQVETVGIMTKYQLVFAKLEASLSKVSSMLKSRNSLIKLSAFKSIQEVSYVRQEKQHLQQKLLYRLVEKQVGCVAGLLTRIVHRNLRDSFAKIIRVNHLKKHEAQIVQDHERFKKEFVVALNKKDAELAVTKRKTDENATVVFNLRNREIEMQGVIKAKEATINQLQRNIADATAITASSASQQASIKMTPQQQAIIKNLEAKIAAAEQEQAELKEKQFSFSSNVSLFVRDMNEVMDGFEGSTMLIGSDENVSLDQSRSIHAASAVAAGSTGVPVELPVEDVLPMYALTNKKASHPTAPSSYINTSAKGYQQQQHSQQQQPYLGQQVASQQQQQNGKQQIVSASRKPQVY